MRSDAANEAGEVNIQLKTARESQISAESQLRLLQTRVQSQSSQHERELESARQELKEVQHSVNSLEKQLSTQTKLTDL